MTTLNDLKQWDEVGVITPQGILGPTKICAITATMIVLRHDYHFGIDGTWKFNRKTGISKSHSGCRVVPWSAEMSAEQDRAKELFRWWGKITSLDSNPSLGAVAAMRAAYEAWEKETDR